MTKGKTMQKKDYERAADIIVKLRVNAETAADRKERKEYSAKALTVAGAFVTFFADDSPAFDVLRFREYIERKTLRALEQRKAG